MTLRIAVIGDIHVRESRIDSFASLFSDISQNADALILCGDLTDTGEPQEAQLLAREISRLSIRVAGLLGNHDLDHGHADKVRTILSEAGMQFIDERSCVIDDVSIVGTKGFGGGFGTHAIAAFGETTVKNFVKESVDEALQLGALLDSVQTPTVIVALHYSPIVETVVGEPLEIYPFLGSSHLMDTIDRFNVAAVFHGHAHHGSPKGKTTKGTPVYNVSRTVLAKNNKDYFLLEL